MFCFLKDYQVRHLLHKKWWFSKLHVKMVLLISWDFQNLILTFQNVFENIPCTLVHFKNLINNCCYLIIFSLPSAVISADLDAAILFSSRLNNVIMWQQFKGQLLWLYPTLVARGIMFLNLTGPSVSLSVCPLAKLRGV